MFDRQFLLTIPRMKAKCEETLQHLCERGIDVELFEGMDANKTGLGTQLTYEVDHPRKGYRMGNKQVNLFLSHYMIWKCALYTTGDSFLVLEDDVRFDEDWRDHLATALTWMPQDWDFLYVGSCCCEGRPRTQIHNRLHETKFALCTHAYAFKRKAIPTLLDRCGHFWSGVDIELVFHALPYLKTYAILPRIVHQHQTIISP